MKKNYSNSRPILRRYKWYSFEVTKSLLSKPATPKASSAVKRFWWSAVKAQNKVNNIQQNLSDKTNTSQTNLINLCSIRGVR